MTNEEQQKDDIETMKILFNADINELCNQRRFNDAREMEGIRDRLIKALEQLQDVHDTCKKCIEFSEFKKQPAWIPVSERLPKAGEYVGDVVKHYLVQNEYGDMLVARYTHSGYWEQIYQLKPYDDEIVAWMPLPQPYKGESEEAE